MRLVKASILTVLTFLAAVPVLRADELDDLAQSYWSWRAVEQPVTGDDITRIERPAGWVPDWSPEKVAGYRQQLNEFEARWKKMDAPKWPVARQVDYQLMGSAIARIRWELELNRSWQRDPEF